MSMQDLHISASLDFSNFEDRKDSEEILHRMLAIMCRLNAMYLRKHPDTPNLYSSGVTYSPPDQSSYRDLSEDKLRKLFGILKSMGLKPEIGLAVNRLVRGVESFLDIPNLYQRGHGDCNELVPARIAFLWSAGIAARPYLTLPESRPGGGLTYHCIVQWPDGSSEDPSLILGMGGPARAADRQEEIRKNKERLSSYIEAAQILLAEGAEPALVSRHIDMLGLLPK